jgi:hypothetical protein
LRFAVKKITKPRIGHSLRKSFSNIVCIQAVKNITIIQDFSKSSIVELCDPYRDKFIFDNCLNFYKDKKLLFIHEEAAMSGCFSIVMKLGLVFFGILVLPVLAEKSPSTLPTSTNTNFAEPLETRTLPITDCVQDMIKTGKAKSIQEAEGKVSAAVTKMAAPLKPGEYIEVQDHQLHVTLRFNVLSSIEDFIYPLLEVSVYSIILPKDEDGQISKILPAVSARRNPAKPIEWRLTEEQFSPILNAHLGMKKQTGSLKVWEASSITYMMNMDWSYPYDIPSGEYYTVIPLIYFYGYLEVNPSPDDREYQLSYYFLYSQDEKLITSDGKNRTIKDKTRIYNTVSFPKDRIYVQRIALNENAYERPPELEKAKSKDPNAKEFKDPFRNQVLYFAFKVKTIGSYMTPKYLRSFGWHMEFCK